VTLFRVIEDWTSPEGKKEDGFDFRLQDSSSPHFTSTESSSVEGVNTWVIGRIGFSKIYFDQVAKNDAATSAANQEALLSVDQGFDEEEEEDGVGGRTLRSPVLLLRRRRRQRVLRYSSWGDKWANFQLFGPYLQWLERVHGHRAGVRARRGERGAQAPQGFDRGNQAEVWHPKCGKGTEEDKTT
jgi:hypothetical protein